MVSVEVFAAPRTPRAERLHAAYAAAFHRWASLLTERAVLTAALWDHDEVAIVRSLLPRIEQLGELVRDAEQEQERAKGLVALANANAAGNAIARCGTAVPETPEQADAPISDESSQVVWSLVHLLEKLEKSR